MASDGPSRDPRASLPARDRRGRRSAATSMPRSARCLASPARRLGASMGAVFVADPDRAGLQLVVAASAWTSAAEAQLATAASDPSHPFAAAARGRVATFDREATTPDGERVRRRLPAAARVRAAASRCRSARSGFGWPAPRELDDAERETLGALAALAALAVDRARLASTAAERSEWFERMAHTDPLTGLANERTVAPDPRARAGARRPPGQRGLARDVRRRRLPGDEPRRRPRRPATTSCAGSPRCSRSRSGWSTRSGGSAATSSCSSRLARPA